MKTLEKYSWLVKLLIFALIAIPISISSIKIYEADKVQTGEAMSEFRRIANTDDIMLISHSDSSYFTGHPNSVVFQLRIDGERTSGQCTDSIGEPLVCTLFERE